MCEDLYLDTKTQPIPKFDEYGTVREIQKSQNLQ